MKKKLHLSPNFTKKPRSLKSIKYVIFHYTGMQSEIESLNRLKNPKTQVSCHYFIGKNGEIFQMVKDKYIAWHAGKSKWGKIIGLNKHSIGIELMNKGHRYGYKNFTLKQINNLIRLCKKIKKKYNIKSENFLGHSDVAPLRKTDPGERFPWEKLSRFKIGNWYNLNSNQKNFFDKTKYRKLFFRNLKKIGYRYFNIQKKSKTDRKIILAFQRRYLPKNVNGSIDKKTLIISYFLANFKN